MMDTSIEKYERCLKEAITFLQANLSEADWSTFEEEFFSVDETHHQSRVLMKFLQMIPLGGDRLAHRCQEILKEA